MSIKGYMFSDASAAADAIAQVNAHYGIPVSADSVTRTYTTYEPFGEQWIIRHVDGLSEVLGEPMEIDEELERLTNEIENNDNG